LPLPEGARLHDVFHVDLLKPFYSAPPPAPPPLLSLEEGRLVSIPMKVLQFRWTLDSWELQVEWEGEPDKEITWEPLQEFKARFPAFQLEDELFVEEGRDVTGQPHQGPGLADQAARPGVVAPPRPITYSTDVSVIVASWFPFRRWITFLRYFCNLRYILPNWERLNKLAINLIASLKGHPQPLRRLLVSASRAPPLLLPANTSHQRCCRPPPPPPSHSYSLREIAGRARNPIMMPVGFLQMLATLPSSYIKHTTYSMHTHVKG
jgi:hypothetical protein